MIDFEDVCPYDRAQYEQMIDTVVRYGANSLEAVYVAKWGGFARAAANLNICPLMLRLICHGAVAEKIHSKLRMLPRFDLHRARILCASSGYYRKHYAHD